MKFATPALCGASIVLLAALLGGCGNKSDLVMPSKSTVPPAQQGQPTLPEAVPPADGKPASGTGGATARFLP